MFNKLNEPYGRRVKPVEGAGDLLSIFAIKALVSPPQLQNELKHQLCHFFRNGYRTKI